MTSPAQNRDDLPVTAQLLQQVLIGTAALPGADFRVLTYYITAGPLGDTVRETAKDIAGQLKLSAGSVSKSIKRLRDENWLERSYTVGSVSFYRAGTRVLDLAADRDEEQHLAAVHHLPVPGNGNA